MRRRNLIGMPGVAYDAINALKPGVVSPRSEAAPERPHFERNLSQRHPDAAVRV